MVAVGSWITSAAVAAFVSILVTVRWERKKLSRAERSSAYSDFLSVFSQRWRAFGDRDGAKKRGDLTSLAELESRVISLRDDLYDAYTCIQILGSQDVIERALACVRLADDRNRAFKNPALKGVGADERSAALAAFVRACRDDLSLAELDTFRLRTDYASVSGALLPSDD